MKGIMAAMKELEQLRKFDRDSNNDHAMALQLLCQVRCQNNWELVTCKFVLYPVLRGMY